mgnify:CR=1 FL=1
MLYKFFLVSLFFSKTIYSFDIHSITSLHFPTNLLHLSNVQSQIEQTAPHIQHHIDNIKEVSSIIYDINKSVLSNFQRNFIYDMVKTSSNILPNVDSIGHHVLHFNNVFIHKIIESKTLDFCEKKKLILWIINMTRKGDDTGSFVLQTYYDFVDKIM